MADFPGVVAKTYHIVNVCNCVMIQELLIVMSPLLQDPQGYQRQQRQGHFQMIFESITPKFSVLCTLPW